jgi:TRAP-type mannitol/chloroaromatic compound transport system permease large subunit
VNILVFILGCFIDFFEIAFIVIPMLAPVAEKLLPGLFPPGTPVDAIMVWFGVIIAMNLQTSFLTPPFGFALFYLRSVAASSNYVDRVTGRTIKAVTTPEIYRGSVAFIVIQLLMLAVVIAFPQLVIGSLDQGGKIDLDSIKIEIPSSIPGDVPAPGQQPGAPASGEPTPEDPTEAILRQLREQKK